MKKRRSKSEVLDSDRFDALLRLGILKARGGQWQEALQLFNEALSVNPRSAEANLGQGNLLAETGRVEEALASYDRALAIRPAFAEALYGRGNALHALKRYEEALANYDRALAIVPGRAEILGNRGNTLHDLKRYEEALASYDEALAILPGVALLHNNRGNTLRELGRFEEALASLDRALALKPGYVEALTNRANTLEDLRRYEEALANLDLALVSNPDDAVVHHNRGNLFQDLQRYEEALASYDKALAFRSSFAEALRGRGNALHKLRRFDEALASYDKALMIRPDYVEALNSRGNVLQELQRYEEALASYDKALAFGSSFAEALHGRGNALHKLGHSEEAFACYEKALTIRPDLVEALRGRGIILEEFQRYEEARASYQEALAIRPDLEHVSGELAWARMRCCDWREREEEVGRLTADVRAGKRSITPFAFLAVSDSAQDQLLCAQIWMRDQCAESLAPIWKGERYHHERIRLAYLSADFRVHASSFLLAGLFEHHDRNRFETIAISFGPDDRSEIRTRVKGALEDFIDVRSKSDLEVARLMREREVDIAVDLMGHTAHSRMGILALRPAPVQVNYLAYPGTMGADYIDYILADRVVIPEQHHPCYTEKVVYLPDTYQVNDSKRVIADRTPARSAVGLPERGFVFCSFNNNYKISPPVFDVWMRLLDKVEGSVLWLLENNAAAACSLRQEAANRGIAPERLVFAPVIKVEDHLARNRLADLFLDTLPYNAHTTASDALWAGLPVVTCLGTTFPGRVGASLLNAIGLPELITHSLEEYETLALELARNPQRLAAIKSKLAANRNTYPLFDTDRFRRHIEAAYTTMWERYQRGEPPASFAVAPIDN
ncbi:MAG TPA: tetratricopeptide repeat protein [Burkholderiales bacterium]|nr:tetratricopeptide repeat protein [Burkholderiales bacterium]